MQRGTLRLQGLSRRHERITGERAVASASPFPMERSESLYSMTDAPPKPKRRWLQNRLRTLLILTAVIAAGLAWWSRWSKSAKGQREAVAALTKSGVTVTYDFQVSGLKQPPHWPAWLVDRLGVDYFASVYSVWYPGNATEIDLRLLKNLTGLQELSLQYYRYPEYLRWKAPPDPINDDSLKCLEGLITLHVLYLNGRDITDAGLEHIQGLTALHKLWLNDTRVTNAGLKYLQRLTALQELNIGNTQITGAALEERLRKWLPVCKFGG